MNPPNKPPLGPTSFLGGPSLTPRPFEQRSRVVEVAPPLKPTPRAAPILTISMGRRVFLRKEAVMLLNLKPGQLLSLHAPERRGDVWLLDTQPRLGRPFKLDPGKGGGRFTRTCEIGTEQLIPGKNQSGQATPATLQLAVGPEHLPSATSPRGIFILLPI